jgi:hypothetical protein
VQSWQQGTGEWGTLAAIGAYSRLLAATLFVARSQFAAAIARIKGRGFCKNWSTRYAPQTSQVNALAPFTLYDE